MSPDPCSWCGTAPQKARGRCGACLAYLTTKGEERPLKLIRRHLDRQVERDLEERARRGW